MAKKAKNTAVSYDNGKKGYIRADGSPCCNVVTATMGRCTLAPGHKGNHEAWTLEGKLVNSWPRKKQKARTDGIAVRLREAKSSETMCRHRSHKNFICTRVKGHTGDHAWVSGLQAWDTMKFPLDVYQWPDEAKYDGTKYDGKVELL